MKPVYKSIYDDPKTLRRMRWQNFKQGCKELRPLLIGVILVIFAVIALSGVNCADEYGCVYEPGGCWAIQSTPTGTRTHHFKCGAIVSTSSGWVVNPSDGWVNVEWPEYKNCIPPWGPAGVSGVGVNWSATTCGSCSWP
jgi:hypothetical protein